MEDERKARECKLKRCYECNRLEDQLWNMAYQQIWPLVRRRVAKQQGVPEHAQHHESSTLAKGA